MSFRARQPGQVQESERLTNEVLEEICLIASPIDGLQTKPQNGQEYVQFTNSLPGVLEWGIQVFLLFARIGGYPPGTNARSGMPHRLFVIFLF
jgi:hypothetical protein